MRLLPLLPLLLVLAPHPPARGADTRQAWLYRASGKPGWFVKVADKRWAETTPDGGGFNFEEVGRTARYVELFDRSRTMWVRLDANRMEWRQGAKPAWNRLYDGKWVRPADLPRPKVVKRDYRIRLAYFVPADRKPTAGYQNKIRTVMQVVAELYRQDAAAHGVRSRGLQFEMKGGEPVVHLVRGRRPASFYNGAPKYDANNQWKTVLPEIPASVGTPTRNVIIVFAETYDGGPAKFEWPGGVALGARFSTEGGVGLFSAWILRPELCATTLAQQKKWLFDTTPIKGRTALGHGGANSPRFEFIEDGMGAVAHELGHALGLPHDQRRDDLDIMGNGFRNLRWNFTAPPSAARRARFSADNARILYTSRYLATDLVLSDNIPPTVSLKWVVPPRAGDTTVKVSLAATDNQGLRAALFFSPAQDSVVGGRALKGKTQSMIQVLSVRAIRPGTFRLDVTVADDGGNLGHATLTAAVGKER